MTLAIIPARGGSKGIRRKNVFPLGGRPLIAWSIEQALEANSITRVIVSTDCTDIATVANDWGADVYWRSPETATDTASTESALLEVIEDAFPVPYTGVVCLLQATSPIRQPGDIDAAVRLITASPCDSVFSARCVEGYIWQLGDKLVPPATARKPRQQRGTVTLEENGSIYVFRADVFREARDRMCGRTVPYIMHPLDSFQLDNVSDVDTLQQLLSIRMLHATRTAAAN